MGWCKHIFYGLECILDIPMVYVRYTPAKAFEVWLQWDRIRYTCSAQMCNLSGSITGCWLHNRMPSYITRYPDAQLVILSHQVMQPAKLLGCLTIAYIVK